MSPGETMLPRETPTCGMRFPDGLSCALLDLHEGPCRHPLGRWYWDHSAQPSTVPTDIAEAARLVHGRRCLDGYDTEGPELGRMLGEILAIAAYPQRKADRGEVAAILGHAADLLNAMRLLRSWTPPVVNVEAVQARKAKRDQRVEATAVELERRGIAVERKRMAKWMRSDIERAWAWADAMANRQEGDPKPVPPTPVALMDIDVRMAQGIAGRRNVGFARARGESATPAPESCDASVVPSRTVQVWAVVRERMAGHPDIIGVCPSRDDALDLVDWRWSATDIPAKMRRDGWAREGDEDVWIVPAVWTPHRRPTGDGGGR